MIELPGEYGGLRCMGLGCTNLTASDLCKVCTIIARAEKAEAEIERLRGALGSIELQSGIQAAWQVASKALKPKT